MAAKRTFGLVAGVAAATVLATACQPAATPLPSPASTGVATVGGLAQESTNASITPDGRYVAFATSATVVPGFVPNRQHGQARRHIYRLDRTTGTIVPVSVDTTGGPLRLSHNVGSPQDSSMSDDGRYIAFTTTDPTVVPHDTVMVQPPTIDTRQDVFVRDVVAGTTRRIELPGSADLNASAASPHISGNGRWVAFVTGSTNIDPLDTSTVTDVYRWDRTTGAIVRVTQAAGGGPTDKASLNPRALDDGSIAFDSRATNMGSGFTVGGNANYAYVKDLAAGTLQAASVASTGAPIPGELLDTTNDGSRLLFRSGSAGVPDDTAGTTVFLRDRATGTTTAALRNASGAVTTSSTGSITANGRYLTLASRDTTIVPGDADGGASDDLFVRDLATNKRYQVNRKPDGTPGPNVATAGFGLSDDGRTVLFGSTTHAYGPDDGTSILRSFVQRTPLP